MIKVTDEITDEDEVRKEIKGRDNEKLSMEIATSATGRIALTIFLG